MKFKKYSDERPRMEHCWVLIKPVESQYVNDAFPWEWHPQDHGKDPCDIEWLDHLDDGDGWIPVSERKPTEEDGLPDGPMRGFVYAQFSDGVFSRVKWNASVFVDGTIIAWRRLPAPYVPPEPPLWESEEDQLHVVDAVLESIRSVTSVFHDDIDYLQRELRKRGYAIRKLEGE